MKTQWCSFNSQQIITNPFTKLSDVPPVFIAIKFFASLIRTCSSPPSSVAAFLPEEKTLFKLRQRASNAARAECSFLLIALTFDFHSCWLLRCDILQGDHQLSFVLIKSWSQQSRGCLFKKSTLYLGGARNPNNNTANMLSLLTFITLPTPQGSYTFSISKFHTFPESNFQTYQQIYQTISDVW